MSIFLPDNTQPKRSQDNRPRDVFGVPYDEPTRLPPYKEPKYQSADIENQRPMTRQQNRPQRRSQPKRSQDNKQKVKPGDYEALKGGVEKTLQNTAFPTGYVAGKIQNHLAKKKAERQVKNIQAFSDSVRVQRNLKDNKKEFDISQDY